MNHSTQQNDYGNDLLSSLFQRLGEYLLDSSIVISPSDVSSAIYAYAKANYIFDMGIFDHLIQIFASHVETNPSSCTVRQICQTIWACGKMRSFESSSSGNIDLDIPPDHSMNTVMPPYYTDFVNLVSYIIYRADELSVQDVTQVLWAMANFDFLNDHSDSNVHSFLNIEPLLQQLLILATQFNTQERASIIWSCSKMSSLSPLAAKIIFILTRPFAQQLNHHHVTTTTNTVHQNKIILSQPQEASIILYSLGRMNIRDIDVFRTLTNYVLDYHIQTASAQTIANILWAHRTVHIEPPRELLESWTVLKLPNLNIADTNNTVDTNLWPYNDYSFY